MSTPRIFLLPCGRMVQGHPMEGRTIIDKQTKQPVLNADGSPKQSWYIAVAIPKMGEPDWKNTEWGALIHQAGMQDWPNGEHGAPTFAWKVIDGDSPVPDQNGQPWNQKEGFPGHWVVKCSTYLAPVPSYHVGKYQAQDCIQNPKEIKCGDYVRVQVEVLGNGPSQSPGVYINPKQLELSRAGQQIITASMPNANDAFGNSQAQIPQNAMLDNGVQQGGYQQNPQQQNAAQGYNQQQPPANTYANANGGTPQGGTANAGYVDQNQNNQGANAGYVQQGNQFQQQNGQNAQQGHPNQGYQQNQNVQQGNPANPAQGYNQAPQNFLNQ